MLNSDYISLYKEQYLFRGMLTAIRDAVLAGADEYIEVGLRVRVRVQDMLSTIWL